MSEALRAVLLLVAGSGLGAIFFGGLWWTIRKGVTSKQPALWFSGSLFLRFALVVGGFYWVGNDHYERLLLCLIGFALAGLAVTWFIIYKPSVGSWHSPPPRLFALHSARLPGALRSADTSGETRKIQILPNQESSHAH
jgi:F1F0 ATPase subunit 2